MKIVAAYLLVVLGGNPNPSADDIRSILESGDQMYRFVLLLHYTAPSAILLRAISSLRNYGVKEASAYSCSGSIRVLCAPDVHSSGAKVGQGEKPLQQGMELYPRIGKNFDIKVFTNCRFGMMSWAVLAVTYCIKQFAYVGSSILGKLALGQGLSALVFVVYRHLIAMLILAPLAYVLERNRRPSFSFGVMLKIFILAMLGITIQQNVYYVRLHLISPTVASALGNVIPAFTFLLAIVLRMEKLNLKTVILLGAFVTSPMIQLHFESPEKGDAWLKGSALMLFGYFACSVSLVLQGHNGDGWLAQHQRRVIAHKERNGWQWGYTHWSEDSEPMGGCIEGDDEGEIRDGSDNGG
ncbi:hypothetical protein ZIOFF_035405 [Zingiber officinale]|uniref:WAT1-related protein n=1 Tax=Zingiber officinale TaxID=94328 RepID=A0A8J5G8V4_ZINOF|nr:hypothetical protein ZIOFF_035405 [Zingiber officinale]